MSDNALNDTHSDHQTDGSVAAKKPLFHSLKVVVSTFLLAIWIVVMLLVHLCWKTLRLPHVDRCYLVFHGGCCWLFNLRCHVSGKMSSARPTLFLSNHVSYIDVFILGKYIPAFFIAKSEVANWPILGWLAKEQNTLFFERNRKKVRGQMQVMADHFDQQGNLILFPEGTSTNGEYIQPFKSSLLQSVELSDQTVMIQPVTLVYKCYQDKLMNRQRRDQYAWYATMPFASHFFTALGLARADVDIVFHEPVTLAQFENRKACALACQQRVATALADRLH
jgi:1-acyl-sn-glycerol-3-phosphate acyltransferase